jgi:C4-dicarboxylate-specific signal transduction histidine kinase
MTANPIATASPATAARRRPNADAARYAILRRLAPALKHDMVVPLQAVTMMAEVLDARLERDAPEMAELHRSISKINRLAREAVGRCIDVAAWIAPGDEHPIALHEGVRDCIALLASGLGFRGFSLANRVEPSGFEVSRAALRNLLAAALVGLADGAPRPGELSISAEVSGASVLVTVRLVLQPEDEELPPSFEVIGPPLDWGDVQALALAESVELLRTHDQVAMRMGRAVTTSPLQIAPV